MSDSNFVNTIEELISATQVLPQVVRDAVQAALASGDLAIGAGSWESELAVCPIAAGAITADVWRKGAIATGASDWGTRGGPSPAVEEFAAGFDICAEDDGLPLAIATVRRALRELLVQPPLAALQT